MSNGGRIEKSLKNMINGIAYRILTILTAFIVRTVFIRCLSNDYLSVNGLYSSILSMLSLAELGFSTAMVYSMYKPLADKDYRKLAQLMNLYKHAYAIIGTVILVVGLCLVPFLDVLIKNRPDIPGLTFYYILFLLNSAISYWFFAYRNSILQADQKSYVISNYSSIFNIIKVILQIIVLLIFHNFTVYLLVEMFCIIMQNICLAYRVKKEYPIFEKDNKENLPKEEKKKIFKDVKALMLQKISFRILNTSDSIIISAFVGVGWVGLLSNYIMIEEAVVAVISQITSAIMASMGNYFAKESKENGYKLFQRVDFMNFWLYGFSTVAFIVLLNPFIELWLGRISAEYVLSQTIVVALIVRFFVEGYMNMMSTFRSTLGLFTQGQYTPLAVAMINIVLSIGLSFKFGAAGVIIATPLARCCINVWYMPLIIHRDGFKKSVRPYYKKVIIRMLFLVALTTIMYLLSRIIIFKNGVTIASFIVMVAITALIPNLIIGIFFYKTDEFQYFRNLVCDRLKVLK